jgi:hypothetical protein
MELSGKDERSNRKTNERGYVKDLGVDGKEILKLLILK